MLLAFVNEAQAIEIPAFIEESQAVCCLQVTCHKIHTNTFQVTHLVAHRQFQHVEHFVHFHVHVTRVAVLQEAHKYTNGNILNTQFHSIWTKAIQGIVEVMTVDGKDEPMTGNANLIGTHEEYHVCH
uniref:Uncharacterized protein n=1 Tax=Lutzomyia longipalpis TaxID=7200 RepID=A0A7G3B6I1_LUTLO